jgi:ABC-2 type transport system permease protein
MRYLKLWLSFLKMSWMADMEYRLNMILRVLGESGWYVAQLSIFEVLYTHAKTISGWDVHGMRVFMATLFLSDALYMIFLMENVDNLFSLVRKGDLDLYLVKPINSQFMVSLRKVATVYVINLILILWYLIWAIRTMPSPVSGWQIMVFMLLMFFGFIALFAIRFMFATLTVLLQDAGNIHFVWHQLYRLAMRPDPIYPYYLRVIVMTVFPVAFFASVPARALIDGFDWRLLAAAPVLAIVTLFLSHHFWKFALKRYSSASS